MYIRFLLLLIMSFAYLPGKIFGQSIDSWDENILDTAKGSPFLNDLEESIVFELNLVRTNPAKYAEFYIEPLLGLFEGKLFKYPEQLPIITKEGKKAVQECIRALKLAKPAGVLYPNESLSKAADDLVNFQTRNGKVGHIGKNRSTPVDRIERYGEWEHRVAENISYGSHSARQIVIALLVDDGVPSRGHRKNILNNDFKLVGLGTGQHPKYGTMCVMDFAGGFKPN